MEGKSIYGASCRGARGWMEVRKGKGWDLDTGTVGQQVDTPARGYVFRNKPYRREYLTI